MKTAPSSDPWARGDRRTFFMWEKCEKTTAHAHHAKLRMSLKHQDQGVEDLRRQECQRAAPQYAAANSVLEKPWRPPRTGMSTTCSTVRAVELTTTTTMRNRNVKDPLGSRLLEHGIGQHRRHIHQLFCHLRTTQNQTRLDTVIGDLGTAMNCSTGVCLSASFKMSASSFSFCGTVTSRICTMGARSARCSTMSRWTRTCGRDL